ncbi:MAG: hypothetical protein RBS08_04540, partial [Bdellovibrionales bacterium]|nr:hypothetical protein [Bdellovibrionales bacterium]
MGKILNSLVISASGDTQVALEKIMQNKIEGYSPKFTSAGFEGLSLDAPEPDIVFINNTPPLPQGELEKITALFAGHTQVLLDEDHDEDSRRAFMRAGVDEVMSLAELQSPLGRHLLEKLL